MDGPIKIRLRRLVIHAHMKQRFLRVKVQVHMSRKLENAFL